MKSIMKNIDDLIYWRAIDTYDDDEPNIAFRPLRDHASEALQ